MPTGALFRASPTVGHATRLRWSPILIIAAVGAIVSTIVPIAESISIVFFTASVGLWGSLTLLATDLIEARIRTNLEEMEKKGKVGRRRRVAANWPKLSLRISSRLWGFAALAFGAELALDATGLFAQANNYDALIFVIGLALLGLAGIETANIFEFIGNRKFRPFLTSAKATSGLLTFCVLIIDAYDGLWGFAILPRIFTLPLWIGTWGILCVVGVVGSAWFIIGIWSKKKRQFHSTSFWVFFSPFVYLTLLGVLIVLGVKL